VGPKTVEAVNKYIATHGEDALVEQLINSRRDFVSRVAQRNPNFPINGVNNRINQLELDWLRQNHGIRNLKK
jgi:hypothetical protein